MCVGLNGLNILPKFIKHLQSEMKMYGCDTVALKQHFGKKLMELEEEKRAVQVSLLNCFIYHMRSSSSHIFLAHAHEYFWSYKKNSEQFQQERDRLLAEVESLNADGQTHKLRDAQLQKLKSLEAQVTSIS